MPKHTIRYSLPDVSNWNLETTAKVQKLAAKALHQAVNEVLKTAIEEAGDAYITNDGKSIAFGIPLSMFSDEGVFWEMDFDDIIENELHSYMSIDGTELITNDDDREMFVKIMNRLRKNADRIQCVLNKGK